ncbi:MAG: DUF1801 domain-containing protein [Nakamurella sp.]
MSGRSAKVDEYLAALDHPLKAAVVEVRTAILESNPDISEHIKWNAPSFRYGGEDRVTFRLQPGNRFQLIFHRGAKVRADTQEFVFQDDTGLLSWVTADRGVVDLTQVEPANNRLDDVVALVNRWVLA